uniref:TetR family transcriptional regulator n=1 Tax=Thermosporothrix sp. COM3 TaxID=2490863 RepID=A0A455SJ67_9CHLR|nr:TetR family transcriptional regulator [Thermosporothrix sp. COM3]
MSQGMRRERNAARTQEIILQAAAETFAENGFDGARMDVIARRAGYNIALLFRYFESKEGIYRAVIERLRNQENDSLGELIAPFINDEAAHRDPEKVRRFLEICASWYFHLAHRHPYLLRLLNWRIGAPGSLFPNIPAANLEVEWGEAAVAFLRKAQEAGLIRPNLDAHLIIMNMFSLSMLAIQSYTQQQLTTQKSLEELCDCVVEMALDGVFPHADKAE